MKNTAIINAFDNAFESFSGINWGVTINDPVEILAKIESTRKALAELEKLTQRECKILSVTH